MKLQNLLLVTILAGALLFSGCGSDKSTTNPIPPVQNQDSAPPLAPTGLQLSKVDDKGFRAVWEPNSEVDLGGYRVYLIDPSPYRNHTHALLNENGLITTSSYVYRRDMDEDVWICVTAVNLAGFESGRSVPLCVTPPPRAAEPVEGAAGDRTGGPVAGPDRDGHDDREQEPYDDGRHPW